MRLQGSENGKRNAKHLRREMTPPEIALWLALRRNDRGMRFRRQHAVGDYVLDFYCAPASLAIEIDGEAHSLGDRPRRDERRDAWLAARGVHVVRYPAREVLTNLKGVVQDILEIATSRRPPPPSAKG